MHIFRLRQDKTQGGWLLIGGLPVYHSEFLSVAWFLNSVYKLGLSVAQSCPFLYLNVTKHGVSIHALTADFCCLDFCSCVCWMCRSHTEKVLPPELSASACH
jgi:hypothetical protein